MFLMTACENDPTIEDFSGDAVAFTYQVEGDYALEYFYDSDIRFTNISELTGSPHWDFGDGSTSTDASPVHSYSQPGTYKVTLTLDGGGSVTKSIMISDISPIVSYTTSSGDEPAEIQSTLITIDVELPNPKDQAETYYWEFPEGTLAEDGTPITTSSSKNPGTLKFANVGSQTLILKTTLGGRELESKELSVQVGYSTPVKTLYFAQKDGNIMAYKIINNLPSTVKNNPFKLNASAGQHAFNMFFYKDTLLYVLDAGKQFYYVDDQFGNMGDGKVSVVSKDGTVVETMYSNVGGAAFDDPYYGYLDSIAGVLYVSDRNTGISKLSLSTRNYSGSRADKLPFWVQNATLGYYQEGLVYGAGNATFTKVGDTWWWGKYFNSQGIFRFKESDILSSATGATAPAPTSGIVLNNQIVKSFIIDEANSILYAAFSSDAMAGFYKIPLSELNNITLAQLKTKRVKELLSDGEGTGSEQVYICQMVLDKSDGSVYFGYRAPSGSAEKSGLKRYNPTTNQIETLVEGIEIYGITINDNLSKLF